PRRFPLSELRTVAARLQQSWRFLLQVVAEQATIVDFTAPNYRVRVTENATSCAKFLRKLHPPRSGPSGMAPRRWCGAGCACANAADYPQVAPPCAPHTSRVLPWSWNKKPAPAPVALAPRAAGDRRLRARCHTARGSGI